MYRQNQENCLWRGYPLRQGDAGQRKSEHGTKKRVAFMVSKVQYSCIIWHKFGVN